MKKTQLGRNRQSARCGSGQAVSALALLWLCLSGLLPQVAFCATLVGAIPFELIRNAVVVKVSIEGQPACDMLFDTGADPSIVDLAVARQIGLKLPSVGVQGEGGGSDVNLGYATHLPKVVVGDIEVNNIQAVALDLSAPSNGLGRKLCGVLGYSLLRSQIVEIDYPQRTIRFLRRPVQSARDAVRLAFIYQNDLLVRGLFVNGKAVVGNFDTGSNGTFGVTAAAVTRLSLESDVAAAVPTSSIGFNGQSENRAGSIREIKIGSIAIHAAPVVFYGPHTGRDAVKWDIRVGNDFFKPYRVTFDFRNGSITLEHARDLPPGSGVSEPMP